MRDDLMAGGILYPGPDINHVPEFIAPLKFPAPAYMENEAPRRWDDLRGSVDRHDGTVLLSSEIVCSANVEQGRFLIDQLGVREVGVIITLRPLHSLVSSTWQEYVKAGDTIDYSAWLDSVFSGPPIYDTNQFWIANNLGELVERWVTIVGAPNVTVIVLDPTDQDRLYRDFEVVLGLERGFLRRPPEDLTNRSMTAGECELVRQLNIRLGGDRPGRHGYQLVPLRALWDMLQRQPAADEPRLVLDERHRARADALSRDFADRITRTGCRVIGRVDDLCPDVDEGDRSTTGSAEVPMEAALALAGALVRLVNATSAADTRHPDEPAGN